MSRNYSDGYNDDGHDERPTFPWREEMRCNAETRVDGETIRCQNEATEVVYSINRQAYKLCTEHYRQLPANLDMLRGGLQ